MGFTGWNIYISLCICVYIISNIGKFLTYIWAWLIKSREGNLRIEGICVCVCVCDISRVQLNEWTEPAFMRGKFGGGQRAGKQAYFCCCINPDGTTAATVTLRNLREEGFFFTFLLGEFIDFITYQSSLYICKLFFCDFFFLFQSPFGKFLSGTLPVDRKTVLLCLTVCWCPTTYNWPFMFFIPPSAQSSWERHWLTQ